MKSLSLLKWLVAFLLAAVVILAIRHWVVASYRISTDAMVETLYEGDYILVNKLPLKDNPGRNRVVLFESPTSIDSLGIPLLISRCLGMPGDTIRIDNDGFTINGKPLPYSPLSLHIWWVDERYKDDCLEALQTLHIPLRDWTRQEIGYTLKLTSFEAWQVKEETQIKEEAFQRYEKMIPYTFIVPQKGFAYRLDETSLPLCREAIRQQTNGEAKFRDGKLYLDGKETSFFFFDQDYYWMFSDNVQEGIDSRHLGFIPADHIVGNAWLCWYGSNRECMFQRIF